jgi:hypothetical protein
MASIHSIMDRFPMVISSVFPKYFREGVESPAIWEHVDAVRFTAPDLTAPGDYKVTAQTQVGELEALVRVFRSPDSTAPLIIYQHGAKEFDTSFKGIFGKQPRTDAHHVLVRAPFHENFRRFLYGIGSLSRYLAMYAVSACLMDAVIRQFRQAGCGPVTVCGTSLGGFISLVHHIRYNTADAYAPLLAGPNLAHCLLDSAYARQTAPGAKGAQRPYVQSRLDFSAEYGKVDHSNVFPLLGRFDQIVMPSANAESYGATPIQLIDRGHMTGSTAFALLREHIYSVAFNATSGGHARKIPS